MHTYKPILWIVADFSLFFVFLGDLLGPWLGHGHAMAPTNQTKSQKHTKNCKNPKYGLVSMGFVGPRQNLLKNTRR
jgi:hypothetical protein